MSKKELEIIESIRRIKNIGYGDYKPYWDVYIAIARVMKYEILCFRNGDRTIKSKEDMDKVISIVKQMEKRGLLKPSKSGQMCKLTVK